jgi:hypothetical protein
MEVVVLNLYRAQDRRADEQGNCRAGCERVVNAKAYSAGKSVCSGVSFSPHRCWSTRVCGLGLTSMSSENVGRLASAVVRPNIDATNRQMSGRSWQRAIHLHKDTRRFHNGYGDQKDEKPRRKSPGYRPPNVRRRSNTAFKSPANA